MAEYVIKLNDLAESPKHYELPLRSSWLAKTLAETDLSADPEGPDGTIDLYANLSERDVIVGGTVAARIDAPCSRCLEPVGLDISAKVSLVFSARGGRIRPTPEELELQEEDLDRDYYSGDEIPLDDSIREHLIVEVPMQPRCERPECVAKWNAKAAEEAEPKVDLRFAGLAGLKAKLAAEADSE